MVVGGVHYVHHDGGGGADFGVPDPVHGHVSAASAAIADDKNDDVADGDAAADDDGDDRYADDDAADDDDDDDGGDGHEHVLGKKCQMMQLTMRVMSIMFES